MSTRWSPALILLAISPVLAQPTARAGPSQGTTLAMVGGRLYAEPNAVPVDDAVVIVAQGRIAAAGPRATVPVPDGATTLDCKGLVITAGFYNNHVHFTDTARWADAAAQPHAKLSAMLGEMVTRYGFTTVVDTASDLENTAALRRRIASGEVLGPRILTAGAALYPPDGVPYYVRDEIPAEVVKQLPQPATPDVARTVVRRQIDAGADIVKLFVGSWVARGKVLPMPQEIADAAVAEAHQRGKVVFAHPSNLAGLEVALRAGVDVLAHSVEDTRGMSDEHYARMRTQNMGMVPTLTLFRGRWLWDVLDEVRVYARGGGAILFGTDVGYLPNFDHTSEYEAMASAGLGWREILVSLTVTPAKRFREEGRRGTIASGMDADLVVLGADPSSSVRAFADVRYTIRGGAVIYQAR